MNKKNVAVQDVSIEFAKVKLEAILALPPSSKGIVLFAHGSASSRHSPRNQHIASVLQSKAIATLLLDLLTPEEEINDQQTAQLRFDIRLLARRLIGATWWVMRNPDTRGLNIGYFGASTGAAAALIAASQLSGTISAIVSRGGRPDLAGDALCYVQSPTLLIVGGNDEPVITFNQQALAELGCREKRIIVVPGATHLFEEPGALAAVATIASVWFATHLASGGNSGPGNTAQPN